MGSTVVIVSNNLPRFRRALTPMVAQMVAKAALDIEAHAKSMAPIDTGALANSIGAEQVGELSWVVRVGVHYGIYVEFGTFKMAAQPYLTPAFMLVGPRFVSAVKTAVKGALS